MVREELVATSFSRTALLLVAGLARLSRALSMESRKLVAVVDAAGAGVNNAEGGLVGTA